VDWQPWRRRADERRLVVAQREGAPVARADLGLALVAGVEARHDHHRVGAAHRALARGVEGGAAQVRHRHARARLEPFERRAHVAREHAAAAAVADVLHVGVATEYHHGAHRRVEGQRGRAAHGLVAEQHHAPLRDLAGEGEVRGCEALRRVVGDAGAAAADKLSSSTPDCRIRLAVIPTSDVLRLEQLGAAALALKAEKRRPVMEIVLKGAVVNEVAAKNDALAVTLVAPAR
jgi:hypothetical protein